MELETEAQIKIIWKHNKTTQPIEYIKTTTESCQYYYKRLVYVWSECTVLLYSRIKVATIFGNIFLHLWVSWVQGRVMKMYYSFETQNIHLQPYNIYVA